MKFSNGDSIYSLVNPEMRQTNVLIFSAFAILLFSLSMVTKLGINKVVSYLPMPSVSIQTSKEIIINKPVIIPSLQTKKLKTIVKKEIATKIKHPVNNWRPSHIVPLRHYTFREVNRPFGRVDLGRTNEISGTEFERLILDSVPASYRPKLKLYVRKTMHTAHKYQVDPFWVLSIMWVESHFNRMARSPVDARGLMQIMPGTGRYIADKLKINIRNKKIHDVILNPNMNIEMGVYYLRYLLKYFDNDYVLATIAYNCGPGRMRRIMKKQKVIGTTNKYLKKVRRVYRFLTRDYISTIAKINTPVLVSLKDKK